MTIISAAKTICHDLLSGVMLMNLMEPTRRITKISLSVKKALPSGMQKLY